MDGKNSRIRDLSYFRSLIAEHEAELERGGIIKYNLENNINIKVSAKSAYEAFKIRVNGIYNKMMGVGKGTIVEVQVAIGADKEHELLYYIGVTEELAEKLIDRDLKDVTREIISITTIEAGKLI